MRKFLVICGPTATGKTILGGRLAKQFDGELVSVDSRQVYRGMDIGTGKDLPKNSKYQKLKNSKLGYYLFDGVPVWMLDVVEPTHSFSVAEYHGFAHKVIEDIWKREKLPILVGGTGLYIKAMIDGIDTLGVPPNPQLRAAYEKKSTEELFNILFHLSPDTVNTLNVSERKNKQRLIRKIEIAQMGVKKVTGKKWKNLKVVMIGLVCSYNILRQRIERRIEKWVMKGAEDEVRKLLGRGIDWNFQAMNALGYRQWKEYFEGVAKKEEVVKRWKIDEWHYARRQLTWFKRDPRIQWFDVTKKRWEEDVEKKVQAWYN
ncbi:MAG: tRNA (adenosine(37)-N6)-dimethylallyltransferase MiaA [Patescibacteria group bacterium]